jgi:small GTP-binding protein
MDDALTFRVVLVGDSEAGKTSIVAAFLRGEFDRNQLTTVGAVSYTMARNVNGTRVDVQIWDTAGQEKYRSIGPIYYRGAAAAIAVFDVTVQNFEESLETWIGAVRRSAADPLVFVVGNKIDLLDGEADVRDRIRRFAQRHEAEFFLTSAKKRIRIDLLFDAVFHGLMRTCVVPADMAQPPHLRDAPQRSCCSAS